MSTEARLHNMIFTIFQSPISMEITSTSTSTNPCFQLTYFCLTTKPNIINPYQTLIYTYKLWLSQSPPQLTSLNKLLLSCLLTQCCPNLSRWFHGTRDTSQSQTHLYASTVSILSTFMVTCPIQCHMSRLKFSERDRRLSRHHI